PSRFRAAPGRTPPKSRICRGIRSLASPVPRLRTPTGPKEDVMASKKSTMRFTGNRTAAIGLIVVCIVGTAILIAARSSDPTSAAAVAPASTLATANGEVPARVQKAPAAPAAKSQSGEAAKAVQNAEPVTIVGCLEQN